MMHITDYMIQIAEEITDHRLPNFTSKDEFLTWRKKRQTEFHQMLGIDVYLRQQRTDLNVKATGSLQNETFRIDKLYFESLPNLYVTANLYVPNQVKKPAPAILYLCGHAKKQKYFYQEHARKFAQLGFIVLILDTIQLGEVNGIHHGTYKHGFFNWISKGYTPAAVEVWNAIRGIDLLCGLPEVNENQIGVTGNSGGGAISWWTASADDRIKVLAPSCGTGTIASHIREKTIDGHCDCMFPNNPYGWSLIEMCALVAPRPLLIVSPSEDKHFTIESVRLVYNRLKQFYRKIGYPEHISFLEFPGPHGYSPKSRKTISFWFLKYLAKKNVHLENINDVDGMRENEKDLLVYGKKIPGNDKSTSVQDWFIPLAKVPSDINSPEKLERIREKLISNLKRESFAAFPSTSLPLDVKIEQKSLDKKGDWTYKFLYVTERNWRLSGNIQGSSEKNHHLSPTAIYLRDAGDERANSNMFASLNSKWLKSHLDVRGTGMTAWGSELNWYVRRSLALTGRTITSMRVWDTLRGIKGIRSLSKIDVGKIILAGKGEMAVVALYAALLDGNISTVILEDPPASLNIPDEKKRMDAPMEILNSLRYADLPTVAALLWPTKIIFIGRRPETYRYTEEVYERLGNPGGVWRIKTPDELSLIID